MDCHSAYMMETAAMLARAYMLGCHGAVVVSQDPGWAYAEARRAAHYARTSYDYLATLYEGIKRYPSCASHAEGWYYTQDGQEYGPFLTQYEADKARDAQE